MVLLDKSRCILNFGVGLVLWTSMSAARGDSFRSSARADTAEGPGRVGIGAGMLAEWAMLGCLKVNFMSLSYKKIYFSSNLCIQHLKVPR